MSNPAVPTFSPSKFELTGYTNPYFTTEQATAVNLVESRVNGQLDWLAQLLGWTGPNYWGNLPATVNQKRQLLGGTYGVYNGRIFPRILSVQNWDDTVICERDDRIQPGQLAYVGDNSYPIQTVTAVNGTVVLGFTDLTQQFYTDISSNQQLYIIIESALPTPFNKPTAGISGDQAFVCGFSNGNLTLYPIWDVSKTTPYRFNVLFTGSTYYFNENVYISLSGTTADIPATYNSTLSLWELVIPELFSGNQLPPSATLVLPQYDSTTSTSTYYTLTVSFQQWSYTSDWISKNVINNYIGTWGNKGGFLPFNFALDSLSIHGFDENNSLYLAPVTRSVPFNELLNIIYYQDVTISGTPPAGPNIGDVWWNNENGSFNVWTGENGDCGSWLGIDYRNLPDFEQQPDLVFADAAAFQAAAPSIPQNSYVVVSNMATLGPSDNIIGIPSPLPGPGAIYMYLDYQNYWNPYKFELAVEADFNNNALVLPYEVPVELLNSDGLQKESISKNYQVSNLGFNIVTPQDLSAILVKRYNNTNWEISPDSILKYIANTSLFNTTSNPLEGEMWWDFANPIPESRTASIFYGLNWVNINVDPNTSAPPAALDYASLVIYCDGQVVTPTSVYQTDSFQFSYTVDSLTGEFDFTFNLFNIGSKVNPPQITISDSLTSEFKKDISYLIFSGIQYYMSPNVANSNVPLRLWKGQALQCVDSLTLVNRNTYINPLMADINSGPGPENWSKYFLRLPPAYQRDGDGWQKVSLVCQNFGYFGTPTLLESMNCPPEQSTPKIYEELVLYNEYDPNIKYVYSEPYFYSNIAYYYESESSDYENAGIFAIEDVPFDDYDEGKLVTYEPLHNRQANLSLPVGQGYGDWEGIYVSTQSCLALSGFIVNDLENRVVEPILPPVWDASVYKYAPTCQNQRTSYNVDANNYKIGYAYFAADLSAAEEGFFDVQQEYSWRYPQTQPKTGYLTAMAVAG